PHPGARPGADTRRGVARGDPRQPRRHRRLPRRERGRGMTLAVENMDVRYGGVEAVRGVSFEVAPGEIVGLIGANGAGKSSTLHAIMGSAPVVGGDVKLGGASVLGRRPEDIARAGIALVP